MNIEVRQFDGEEWPEKRISISDKDSGYCLFVNARYADLAESKQQAEFIAHAIKHVDALADALAEIVSQYVINGFVSCRAVTNAEEALKAYRGEE